MTSERTKGGRSMRAVPAHRRIKELQPALVAILLLVIVSCKKTLPAPAPNLAAGSLSGLSSATVGTPQTIRVAGSENVSIDGGKDSYAHVTYAPAVKMFEDADLRSTLMGISSDGHGFLFQNAPAKIQSLQAGDIVMVKNELAIKVLGVTTQDDKTLVLAGQPSLREMVQDGVINIDAPVRFHGPKLARAERGPLPSSLLDLLATPAYAQSGLQGSTADVARQQGTTDAAKQAASNIASMVTDGWTVKKWSVVAGAGQANIDLVITKSQGGFVAMIAMKGWIGNFDFVSNVKMNGNAPQQLFQGVKNMQGSLQFDWEIGKSSPGVWATEDRVKLPGGMSISLAPLLEGMPLTLDVSSALLIHPALTGGGEYSRGGFSIAWGNGNAETSSTGAVTGDNTIAMTYNITSDQNVSPIAPNAMVVSYCAPRIELRLDVLGPFASSLSSFGSKIDSMVTRMESVFPQSILDAVAKSPLSKVTASNILASNADVYVQFIATEGTTHAANQSPMPCSKQEIKFTAQGGTAAQFFGLTDGAKSITDLFTKSYTRWNPASDFCKKV
jgi:hypothetical protein